jgi:HK97 gp10 family phage protein
MSVKVKGLDKAIRELSRSGDRAVQVVKGFLADTATDIEQDAKQDAPFEIEGVVLNIKQRIDKNVEDNGLVWKVGIQGTQDFDAYVEFGTGQSAKEILFGPGYTKEMRDIAINFKKKRDGTLIGQPFLFPAWIKNTANLVEELKAEVAKAIK